MALNCGIVGLPNVGKSTIFSAVTAAPAEAANYPFCTIEPNVGIVALRDERMDKIAEIVKPEKIVPTVVELVDIAGLVKGASQGEGLGNQFLGHIRQVNAILHIVRCFENTDIIHVNGKIDPLGDIETINIELALADLDTISKRQAAIAKLLKSQDKAVIQKTQFLIPVLEKLKTKLEQGIGARNAGLDAEEMAALSDLHLITIKPVLYVCNVDEESLANPNEHVLKVLEFAKNEGSEALQICGQFEAELAALETRAERQEMLESMGVTSSGLDQLAEKAYKLLGLRTYFTAGKVEVRAWTFKEGSKAPQAAAVIHTDFEKGFIKAEVYHYDDLMTYGSEQKVKEAGKFRIEGKEYLVKDGDILHFRFNV